MDMPILYKCKTSIPIIEAKNKEFFELKTCVIINWKRINKATFSSLKTDTVIKQEVK